MVTTKSLAARGYKQRKLVRADSVNMTLLWETCRNTSFPLVDIHLGGESILIIRGVTVSSVWEKASTTETSKSEWSQFRIDVQTAWLAMLSCIQILRVRFENVNGTFYDT